MRLPRSRRGATIAAAGVLALVASACAPSLPASVVEGSEVTVAWSDTLTSLNAATTAGDTAGNRQIAAATRGAFASVVDGEVVTDESFGKVGVTDKGSFTVRYDLAEPTWSDQIPVDAADLMLAWAASSNATAGLFDSTPSELQQSASLPTIDDFGRSIDVTFDAPIREWQTALDIAVPAHVVGEIALDIEDPMEAKQAVIDAITDGDAKALTAIASVWNTGFDLETADTDLPEALTVSSGAYRVASIAPSGGGAGDVVLEVNRAYTGDVPPSFQRIRVVTDDSALDSFPADEDIRQFLPTPEIFETVRDLERRDHHLATSDSGELWTLVLRTDDGDFTKRNARRAFLRAVPTADLVEGGSGVWEDAYSPSQSLLFSPGSDGYTIALEDAGLRQTLQSSGDPEADRRKADVGPGVICVLYDNDDTFATGAYAALQAGVAEAGWEVSDCGESDVRPSLGGGGSWQAAILPVALPESPDDIPTVWGGEEASPLTGQVSKARAELVAELAGTPDVYDAREIQVAIEAGLVKDAVALPLTMDPVLTLSARSLKAVMPDSGGSATLLSGAATWEPED